MYGKSFESLYTGSMFGQPSLVFAVWGYAITYQRSSRGGPHYVELNPLLLAPMFASSVQDVLSAIDVLCSPDPASRSPEMDGRRLVKESGAEGGPAVYLVVNGAKYRAMRDEEDRRLQIREAVRRHRASKQGKHSNTSKPGKSQAEAEAEAEPTAQIAVGSSETASPSSEPLLVFETVGAGAKSWNLTAEQVASWERAYPSIDVLAQSRQALAWLRADPARRKTAKGMARFLVGWLNRSTNSGGGRKSSPSTKPASHADGVDWFVECQQLHQGECNGRYKHGLRMQREQAVNA